MRFDPGILLLPKIVIGLDFPLVTKLLAAANREEEGSPEAAIASKLLLTKTKIPTLTVQYELDEFSVTCCLRFTLMFRMSVGILVVFLNLYHSICRPL